MKNIFIKIIIVFLLIFCKANNSYGMEDIEERSSRNFCCPWVSKVFKCFSSEDKGYEKVPSFKILQKGKTRQTQKLRLKKTQELGRLSFPETFLGALPVEILMHTAYYLTPLEILQLRKTCVRLYNLLKDQNFWKRYNKRYNYTPWDIKIPLMHCAFAHYFYNLYISANPVSKQRRFVYKAAYLKHPASAELVYQWDHQRRMAEIEERRTISDYDYLIFSYLKTDEAHRGWGIEKLM